MNKNDAHRDPRHGPHYGGPQQYGDPMYYGQAAYGGEAEGGVDLMRLMMVALRHWKTIVLMVLLAGGSAFLYLKFATPMYRTSALMEMSVRKPRLIKESAVIEEGRADQDTIFNTRLKKFQSRAMRSRVAQRYLEANPGVSNSVEQVASQLMYATAWSVQRKTFIVEVSVESADPVFAQQMANLYAECATQMMIEENRSSSENAVSWLKQQAEQQQQALSAAEQAIVDYRTEASLDLLRNKKRVSEETLLKLNETLVDLESKLITDRSLLGYLQELKANPGVVETIPSGIASAEQLQSFVSTWWEAKINLSALQERYTVQHPQVKEAEAELKQLRQRLDGYLSTISGTVKNGVQLLEDQIRDIRARIELESKSILKLELQTVQAEGRLNTLTREQEAADAAYRSVLARIEESRMAADENTAVLKLLQEAEEPRHPFAPVKMRVLALGLLLGAMLGYGLAWLMELVEDKLTGVKDVEAMGLEMMALIPKQKETERSKLATLCLQDKFSHVSETFASLRTMLTFQDAKERYTCLLVTSTQPEEGKTITACNLAITMAQSGRKTLLIDFDLRRPRLRNIFAKELKVVSLLHTLEKGAFDQFEKLPVPGGHENLSIITSKPSEKISAAEMVGGKGPAALIAWAREKYECVIIDSPPLGVVGDSQSIADYVDGVILAARPEHTRKRALRHTVERMQSINTNVIGVVLNNVTIRKHFTYSSSYHHYGSYYSYGSYAAKSKEGE